MNSAHVDGDLGGLTTFRERLAGGVQPAAARSRPAGFDFRQSQAPENWPGDALAALDDIHRTSWNDSGRPLATVRAISADMRARRPLLATVLFSPHHVFDKVRQEHPGPGKGLVDSWAAMAWIVEAAWNAVASGVGAEDGQAGISAADAALLRPLAARLRFLVLSEPSRWRAEEDAWWAVQPDSIPGGSLILTRVFGTSSWNDLVARAQEARRSWKQCLDEYQSHPLLSQARPAELERELRALVFRQVSSSHLRRVPLGLSVRPAAERSPLTAEDLGTIADVVEQHLLPRFAILDVAHLALYDGRRGWLAARDVFASCVLLTGLGSVACAAGLLIYPAVWLAAACYASICAGVLVLPAGWATMWLLRMPAASTVGVIALLAVLAGSWFGRSPTGWLAAGALAAASCGYLLVEARNHGAAPWAALRRAATVALAGVAHAVMVAVIGLVVVAPAFVSSAGKIAALWHSPDYRHTGLMLALAAAWCLAVGVFSQILWEDRPITAALAHLSWRRGR